MHWVDTLKIRPKAIHIHCMHTEHERATRALLTCDKVSEDLNFTPSISPVTPDGVM